MDSKHMKRPPEGLVEPEEGFKMKGIPGPEESFKMKGVPGDDVEGHGLPITAPPSIGLNHGGEIVATDDDEPGPEGIKRY